MTVQATPVPMIGTVVSELLDGTRQADVIVGLDGNDQINGGTGDDLIYGDFVDPNMLLGAIGATSFAQYAQSGAWSVTNSADGHSSMSQTVQTAADTTYSISFELAANYGAGSVSGAVEVLWNGEVIHSFDTNSATFSSHDVSFQGTGGPGELTFRSIDSTIDTGPEIHTDGVVYWYEKAMQINGEEVKVKAIAEGQTHIFQVMDGTLQAFDVASETYQKAGSEGTVNVNALGFNQADDMLYAIAVGQGIDSLGNTVEAADLVMFDAAGDSYKVGSTPYRSWTGDFDASGNLWVFNSSMDWINKIDVDQVNDAGEVATETFKLPRNLIKDGVWDVAYDAATQTFTGMVKPDAEGEASTLLVIDVSNGTPSFENITVTHTIVDGESLDGVPFMTFGAAIHDADGNLYVGGNGGDHDMNNATATTGAIYKVVMDAQTGTAHLELVASAPQARSNDGAADPRAMDPFTQVDKYANILIRAPQLTPELPTGPEGELTPDSGYDDTINGGIGQDTVFGNIGQDTLIGASGGDTLHGEDGDDAIYGGAGPEWTDNGLISVYDDQGNRFDQFGNPLPADDDVLFGGAGDDLLSGSAGHDTLDGGTGSDTLSGGSGNDTLFGGAGDDTMSGGGQDDTMSGGDGDDVMTGGSGDNRLFGGAGNDQMTAGAGTDYLEGGDGDDTIYAGNGDDHLVGGAGADSLDGGSDNDRLEGGAGNDTLEGGTGNDYLDGGTGADRLLAGSGDDVLMGGDGNDYLAAWKGDDVLDGGAGNDKLYLGAGTDIASGGTGNDVFIFRADDLDGASDTITDFRVAGTEKDRLDLRGLGLLDGGLSETEWLTKALTQNDDFSVTVDLGKGQVTLLDQFDAGNAFYDQVWTGIVLA